MYNYLQVIKNTGGTIEKKRLLKQGPKIFENILFYTYNPFMNYYIKNLDTKGIGTKFIDEETFKLLDRLNKREITGNQARYITEEYIKTLSPNNARLFLMILDRSLDIGLAIKSINSVFPDLIPTYDVMLAQKVDWKKIFYPYIASPKFDGIRATFIDGKFYTRSGKLIVGIHHLEDKLKDINLPFDGELLIPGKPFQISAGQIRSLNPSPNAHFYPFDIPIKSAPFTERLEVLNSFKNKFSDIHIVDHFYVNSKKEIMSVYQKQLEAGLEGLVLKDPNHYYVQKRSSKWMKLKNISSVDVPIIDFIEGEGKYASMLGALVVQLDNGEYTDVGTGFSDNERKEIWDNKEKYRNKTIEVLFHEYTIDGRLRHPRFFTFREDK